MYTRKLPVVVKCYTDVYNLKYITGYMQYKYNTRIKMILYKYNPAKFWKIKTKQNAQ